jgi:hypothetical protein
LRSVADRGDQIPTEERVSAGRTACRLPDRHRREVDRGTDLLENSRD